MPRAHRLRQSRAIQMVYARGRSWADARVALHARPVSDESLLVAVVAGKKVGRAVQRNRARRRIREAMRHCLPRVRRGFHLVLVARAAARDATWGEMRGSVEALLSRAALMTGASDTARPVSEDRRREAAIEAR